MEEIKVLFENVTQSSGWSGPEIVTAILAAAAAIVSGISLCQTGKWNKKKIDADLKAKARIEWIQNARNETSELITQIAKLHQSYDAIVNGSLDSDGGYGRAYNRFNESYSAINKLILFFGPDDIDSSKTVIQSDIKPGVSYENAVGKLKDNHKNNDCKNNEIVGILKLLKGYLEADEVIIKEENFKNSNNKKLEYAVANDLNDILRLYFKLEWNRAKNGE